uniref:Glycine-rich protein DOT1-like n=1 Tax=Phascolarctos cinereus TaxID=38626 RepID=A0A6P5KMC8_PHACI|nr:glycine-rich protein DOT1-like [Phascolarctos cinereus]
MRLEGRRGAGQEGREAPGGVWRGAGAQVRPGVWRGAGGGRKYDGNGSVARRCACVAERGSEAVSSAPFPAVAGAELGGGRGGGGGGGSSSVGRGTLHTGRWPEVAHRVPPGINDLTRSRSRRCRSGVEGRWFGGRAGRGLRRRRRGQERRQAVRGAARAGAAAAASLGAWGGRAVPGWASPGRRLPAAQLVAGGGYWRQPFLGPVMSA